MHVSQRPHKPTPELQWLALIQHQELIVYDPWVHLLSEWSVSSPPSWKLACERRLVDHAILLIFAAEVEACILARVVKFLMP